MKARSGSILAIQVLAVIDSILLLALVVVAGLVLGLIFTRGVTHLTSQHLTDREFPKLPAWMAARLPLYYERNPISPAANRGDAYLPDTGLYPMVAAGQFSRNPLQRAGSRALAAWIARFRPLRDNLGALQSLLMVGLVLLLAVTYLGRFRRQLSVRAACRAASGLRHQIHRQEYRLGQSSLPTEGAGPVVNIFTRDVNDVRDGLIADLESTYRLPVLAVGLLAIALFLSPTLTFFLLSLGGLVWLVSIPLNRAVQVASDAAARDSAVFLCLLHEDLGMLRTVRVYGMEAIDKKRFEEHLEQFQIADERRLQTEDRRYPTTFLLAGAAAFLAVGVLGYNVLESRVGPASALVLSASLIALARPVSEWIACRRQIQQADRSAQGIFEFLERKPELQMSVGARFLSPMRDRISFENVSLTSPTGRTLLASVSAEIPAGSRTAIMSLDEESKHAMVCLIPRLIDPQSGRVRIDGIDLREVTLESLRAQVGMVLQADLVFSDSVLNNIGLGDPSFMLPRIIEAAKVAHAHNFIQDLPQGYETVIGQLGYPLSIDEQYRIALARAYLHDPSIVIIEEPYSAINDEIKPLIDDTIDRLAPGRTLIFLPHRLSTIRKCNQVIVLHNGHVESIGAPREIHNTSKLYRHIQYVEFNQFASGEIEAGQMG